MWIELLTPEEAAVQEPYPITPPGKRAFELRVIIWETKNVVAKDKILGKVTIVFKFVVSLRMLRVLCMLCMLCMLRMLCMLFMLRMLRMLRRATAPNP
jgi:hypothetical protein